MPAFSDMEDGSGNRLRCSYTSYDGKGYATGQTQQSDGWAGDHSDRVYAIVGTRPIATPPVDRAPPRRAYDAYGNAIATTDADANAGIADTQGCTVGSTAIYHLLRLMTARSMSTRREQPMRSIKGAHYQLWLPALFGLWPLAYQYNRCQWADDLLHV